MINWLRQVASVTLFGLKSIGRRKGSALAAGVGIAGVVGVFVGVLSIAEGVNAAMSTEGPKDFAIVLRKTAINEGESSFSRDEVRVIADTPGVARTEKGPLASGEAVRTIMLPKLPSMTGSNVPLRGVEPMAFDVRGDIRFVEGRNFEPGKNEVIAGVGAARSFAGLTVGNSFEVGRTQWKVVGIFAGGGGSAETEVWTDTATMQSAYHDVGYKSVYVKLASPDAFDAFKKAIESDSRVQAEAQLYGDYLSANSVYLRGFISLIGIAVGTLMALGAIFGAMNTMYSAVAARTREIATLRALGFGAGPVVLSVLVESTLLAILGGAVGALAAYLLFDGFQASTINFNTFTQLAFAFRVTPDLVVTASILAVILGVLGGLFPAIRAARLPIAAALRQA